MITEYTQQAHKLDFFVISTKGEIFELVKISPLVEMTKVQLVNVSSINRYL